jgi:hypothetical protein
LNKTVHTNDADILSNIAAKISHSIATNYSKNASVATTAPKASENRKISSCFTFTNTAEQSAATFAKVFKSGCFECSLAPFPVIEEILKRHFKPGSQLVIALDRTQWKENNVLMVSAIYKKRALPIFWVLLEKDGSSNLAEQQKVLRPVIRLLKKYKLVIVGDREFHSIELAKDLQEQNVSFVLRQKQSTTFREKRQEFQPLSSIPIHPGIRQFYTQINLTQKAGKGRFNLAVYWKRKYRGKQEDEAWYLLTNLPDLKTAIKIYSQRFGIEAMFKDCKTGGYNLEGSKANPNRLVRLILLIALAMTAAWLQGERTVLQRQQSYVCRAQEKGKTRKRHSDFWIGLYGQNWIVAFHECQVWVEELIKSIRNKQAFYRQGLRAMTLIQQAF